MIKQNSIIGLILVYLYTKHCDLAVMIHPNKHIKLGRNYLKLKVAHGVAMFGMCCPLERNVKT